MTDKRTSIILNSRTEFLYFLRSKFRLYHKSNLFFRDMHFGVAGFLQDRGFRLGYEETESIARNVIRAFVAEEILREIDPRTWTLNYEEFQKVSSKSQAPAKSAVSSQQSQKPAGDGALHAAKDTPPVSSEGKR